MHLSTLPFNQRYLYYIQRGIDTEHVAPLEDSWLQHVMTLLDAKLRVIVYNNCMYDI